jgi:short-subunit dehydrogenase
MRKPEVPLASIAGRVVIITGASSGIGAAAAIELSRQGASVVLAARRVEKLEAIAEKCRAAALERANANARAIVVPCDVAKRDDVFHLVTRAKAELGRVDVMFANAGYGIVAKIQNVTEEQFDDIVATNIKGSLYAMQAAAEIMLKQDPLPGVTKKAARGHIMLTSSGAGRRGMPFYGVYSMTKSAQLSLAEAMRVELRDTGVYVSTVHPLTTATEFFDVASEKSDTRSTGVNRAQTAEKVAKKIAAHIRRPKPELWPVRGSRFALVLATMMPRVGDLAMAKTVGKRKR